MWMRDIDVDEGHRCGCGCRCWMMDRCGCMGRWMMDVDVGGWMDVDVWVDGWWVGRCCMMDG